MPVNLFELAGSNVNRITWPAVNLIDKLLFDDSHSQGLGIKIMISMFGF